MAASLRKQQLTSFGMKLRPDHLSCRSQVAKARTIEFGVEHAISAALVTAALLFVPAKPLNAVTLMPGDIVIGDQTYGDDYEGVVIHLDPHTSTQTIISSGGYLDNPWGIEVLSDGEIVVSDAEGLLTVNPQTGEQTQIPSSAGTMRDFAIADNGDFLVTGISEQLIGEVYRVVPTTGETNVVASGWPLDYFPHGIAIDDQGDLIVGNSFVFRDFVHSGPMIVRIDPSTGEQSIISNADDMLQRVYGVALDSDGSIIVAASDARSAVGSVQRVDLDTGEHVIVSSGNLLAGATGITLDEHGNYLLANRDVEAIIHVDRNTGDQTVLASGGLLVDPISIAVVPFPSGPFPPGDFNQDGVLYVDDIDALIAEVRAGTHDLGFDVTDDGLVDDEDRRVWVEELKGTFFGDCNLDGRVDASDLNDLALNWRATATTSWAQGDFNGDHVINATDLNDIGVNWRNGVSTAAVPEPNTGLSLILGIMMVSCFCRRTTHGGNVG